MTRSQPPNRRCRSQLAHSGYRNAKTRARTKDQAAPNMLRSQTCHFCACRVRRGNSQRLAKSSPYAGFSAGAEVARLRKWHVWCLLELGEADAKPRRREADRLRRHRAALLRGRTRFNKLAPPPVRRAYLEKVKLQTSIHYSFTIKGPSVRQPRPVI